MPELPEVETTVLFLRKKVLQRTFLNVWTDAEKLVKRPAKFSEFSKQIIGRKIEKIERKGKLILFYLSQNKILLFHQKLTGHLLLGKWRLEANKWIPQEEGPLNDQDNSFIHLMFYLDKGLMMALCDLRKFAKVELWDKTQLLKSKEFKSIGIDPLSDSFGLNELKKLAANKKVRIKRLLMDQRLIAGIGNIYSDEILFDARVSPLRQANSLNTQELTRLYHSIKKMLRKGIKLGGASVSDYRRPDGSRGDFDKVIKVYRKEGTKCPRCGAIIQRVIINGRSAHFCPHCQK